MNDIQRLRQTELSALRAANRVQSGWPAQSEPGQAVAPSGVSERKRADIVAKIDAIEAQMRAQWATPEAGQAPLP